MYQPKDGDIVAMEDGFGHIQLVMLCRVTVDDGWEMTDWPDYRATVEFNPEKDAARVVAKVEPLTP